MASKRHLDNEWWDEDEENHSSPKSIKHDVLLADPGELSEDESSNYGSTINLEIQLEEEQLAQEELDPMHIAYTESYNEGDGYHLIKEFNSNDELISTRRACEAFDEPVVEGNGADPLVNPEALRIFFTGTIGFDFDVLGTFPKAA